MTQPNETSLDAVKSHVDILRFVKKKQAELKEIEERSRAAIEEALGDNETGTLDGTPVVRWKRIKANRLNQRKLKEKHPEIVALFSEQTETRRFEVLND